MARMMEAVGFVGIGIMGAGMAANLQRRGYPVHVYSRNKSKAEDLGKRIPITIHDSLESLAHACNVVMLCVTDTADVEELVIGQGGLAYNLAPGSLVIDCSTISPTAACRIAQVLWGRRLGFVDAPVSGGSEGAEKGTLAVMAGGEAEDFARARPFLEAIGSRITHMGAPGSGQSTKLLNQILVVVNMLAVSEALIFGTAAGLDLSKAIEAVEHGAAGSWMLSQRAPQVVNDYWDPGFTIDLQQKDLRLVLETAATYGIPLFATGMVSQLYARLQRAGKGGLGNHALIQALENLAGFTVSERKAAS